MFNVGDKFTNGKLSREITEIKDNWITYKNQKDIINTCWITTFEDWVKKINKNNNMGKISGFIGGTYEDCGIYNSKVDADRGIMPDVRLWEIFEEYQGKKIEITIKEIS